MKGLQALVSKKRQAAREAGGERKWAKRVEREEVERFGKRAADVKPAEEPLEADEAAAVADKEGTPDIQAQESVLSDTEVRRRLRRLGHPVTLFAEDSAARYARLRHIERTVEVHDEEAGGGERANVLHTIAKEDRLKAQAASQSGEQNGTNAPTPPKNSANGEEEAEETSEQVLKRQFEEAAERLRVKRKLEQLPPGERIIERLKIYMKEWRDDLDARPAHAVNTTVGLQATNGLRQTEKAFEVLYSRLRDREVHNEITTCLTMIMDALADRHYQRANEVYLQLSIGNQQWPIGVTSIGIHDRTAREKLSYYSNTKSQAHIMNDEATRKYLHGISRLIAAVQRLHPADPSRSYNFNAVEVRTEQLQPPNNHEGLGAKSGNQKARLLQIKQAGEDSDVKAPLAPQFLAADGSVNVPQAWGNMLRSQQQDAQ